MRAQARRCATVPLGHGLLPISFYRKRRLVRLKVLCFHSVCLKRQCSVSQGRWPVVTVQLANGYCLSQYCSFNILHKFSGHKSACLCPRSCGWVSIYKPFNRMGWFLYIFQSINGQFFFRPTKTDVGTLFSSPYQLYACYAYTGCPKSLRICYNLFICERRVY